MEKSFFHILDIRKEAPLNIHVQVFVWTYGFISLLLPEEKA